LRNYGRGACCQFRIAVPFGNSKRSRSHLRTLTCAGALISAAFPGIAVPPAERAVSPVRISAKIDSRPAAREVAPAPAGPVDLPATPVSPAAVPLPPGVPPLGLPSDGELAPAFPGMPELLPPLALPGASEPADENATDPGLPDPPATDTPPEPPPPTAPSAPSRAALDFAQWHRSPRAARETASRENRCMLLVFTGSQGARGENAQAGQRVAHLLNTEVLGTPEFNEFALGHLVLSYLDYTRVTGLQVDGPELDREKALKHCKEALDVHGFPTVILFAPDGHELNRWTGYAVDAKTGKGRGGKYFDEIKEAVLSHEAVLFEAERRREKLAGQGYREWSSVQGSRVFAKLIEFDARTAVLRDEDGRNRTVELRQLGIADRELITRQRLGKLPLPLR
jgi:hypothetical protein